MGAILLVKNSHFYLAKRGEPYMTLLLLYFYIVKMIGVKGEAGAMFEWPLQLRMSRLLMAQGLRVRNNVSMNVIIFIIIYFCFSSVQAESATMRYGQYVFAPLYGEELEQGGFNSDYSQVLEQLNPAFKPNARFVLDGLDGKFFLVDYKIDKEKRREYLLEMQKKSPLAHVDRFFSSLNYLKHDGELIELRRDNRKGGVYFFADGHSNGDYLYCIDKFPLFTSPLLDNEDYLFHVTSMGLDHTNRGMGYDYFRIDIYKSGENARIWGHDLLLANYFVYGVDDEISSSYWFPAVTDSDKKLDGVMVFPEELEGRKRYSKIFINDFDSNNRLDLIVWNREYASARRDDIGRDGFYLDKQWFELYEENQFGDNFTEKVLDVDTAHTILERYGLGWDDGYPNENLCTGHKKSYPYMMYIQDTEIDPLAPKPWKFR
jgi:hypothetical protein